MRQHIKILNREFITETIKQTSRDQRGDDMKLLLNNSINQTNAINAINQRLDTMN